MWPGRFSFCKVAAPAMRVWLLLQAPAGKAELVGPAFVPGERGRGFVEPAEVVARKRFRYLF